MKPQSNLTTSKTASKGFVGRILAPLRRPQVITNSLLISIFVAGALACLDARLTNHQIALKVAASTETAFLASELINEVGPDFVQERATFARLIAKYTERIEARAPGTLLLGELREVRQVLDDCDRSKEGSRKAIHQAGTMLARIALNGAKDAQAADQLGLRNVPTGEEIPKEYLDVSLKSADAFLERPSLEGAELACMDSRLAAAFLFRCPGVAGRNDAEVRGFTTRLEVLEGQMLHFAETLPSNERKRIELYAHNIGRRQTAIAQWNETGAVAARESLLASLRSR